MTARPARAVALIILDGWGYREATEANAIRLARTPHWDRLWAHPSRTLLAASGRAVGLPAGQMGNSEVGHLNLGAGRVVMQDLVRIGAAIEDGTFFANPALRAACAAAVTASPACRNRPRAIPTPSGVPVKIRSPGTKVQMLDKYSTRTGTEKIRFEVRDSCMRSPATSHHSAMSSGFGKASTDTTAGPIGP